MAHLVIHRFDPSPFQRRLVLRDRLCVAGRGPVATPGLLRGVVKRADELMLVIEHVFEHLVDGCLHEGGCVRCRLDDVGTMANREGVGGGAGLLDLLHPPCMVARRPQVEAGEMRPHDNPGWGCGGFGRDRPEAADGRGTCGSFTPRWWHEIWTQRSSPHRVTIESRPPERNAIQRRERRSRERCAPGYWCQIPAGRS
jgi:hypothetical protein